MSDLHHTVCLWPCHLFWVELSLREVLNVDLCTLTCDTVIRPQPQTTRVLIDTITERSTDQCVVDTNVSGIATWSQGCMERMCTPPLSPPPIKTLGVPFKYCQSIPPPPSVPQRPQPY